MMTLLQIMMVGIAVLGLFSVVLAEGNKKMCDLGPVVEQCASKSKTHRRRYYYDDKLDDCHPFTYRGCRVKKAHFHTLDACKNTCKKKNI
ncbi:putative salivary protein KUN-5 [Ixodes scapularis]